MIRFFIVVIILKLSLAHAQTNYGVEPYQDNSLEVLKQNVRTATLSNGLRVILHKRGAAPVFAGAVVTRVGGVDELRGQTGISHIFEHMAFKGTSQIGTKDFWRESELLKELEQLAQSSNAGSNLTAEQRKRWDEIHRELKEVWITDDFTERFNQEGAVGLNATTDKELTKYFVSLPKSAFEFWCRSESARLREPVMRQFYQERDVVLEERRMRYEVDPVGKLYELMLGTAFTNHPYRQPVIGYEQDIRGLTASQIEEFRKRYYVPSNIVISLVGDIDFELDLKVIERYFSTLPSAEAPGFPRIKEVAQEGERRVTLRSSAAPKVMIAYKKPSANDIDDPAISVMNQMLAGTEVSPLQLELVNKKQVASSISFEDLPGFYYPNLFVFFGEVKSPHSSEDFISAFDTVINNFKKSLPTRKDLESAKRIIAVSYLAHIRSNQALALDLATSELLHGSWREFFEWYDKMQKITVADVSRVAKQYLDSERRTVASIETREVS